VRFSAPSESSFLKSSAKSWSAILDGDLKKQAREVIRAIARELREPSRISVPDDAAFGCSLASGQPGLAVLYAYLAKSEIVSEGGETAVAFLNAAVEAVADVPSDSSFYAGFTGTAWAMAHLHDLLFEADDHDTNSSVDEVLCEYLKRSPWRDDYDIVSGLVGFGVYALERLPRQTAIACLDLVLDRLDETAERTTEGVSWFTRPELLPEQQRKEYPDGQYNLGLAHGVPGVIALLGQVCATHDKRLRSARQKARPLLDGTVTWLLAQEPADRTQSFPHMLANGVTPTSSRLAWCYGDLGIAVALLQAARGACDASWEKEALRIARRCADRPAEKAGVVDCGLCHGAAGVGHLFNRLFQATRDETFRNAARLWFARTFEMRQVNKQIAGFPARRPNPDRPNEIQWVADPGILTGAAGVALALLAATTDIEPEWDRMMLVSIPTTPVV
jgi:lantibiotic modifying enzyme